MMAFSFIARIILNASHAITGPYYGLSPFSLRWPNGRDTVYRSGQGQSFLVSNKFWNCISKKKNTGFFQYFYGPKRRWRTWRFRTVYQKHARSIAIHVTVISDIGFEKKDTCKLRFDERRIELRHLGRAAVHVHDVDDVVADVSFSFHLCKPTSFNISVRVV